MLDKINIKTLLITAILLLAIVLRVFALNKFPPELFGDEIDVGYQAYSLLHTARDYRGQLLPTYMHSFAEWRAPLLMYATVPFVALFGLNEWGVRLTPVFFGVLSIFMLYWFLLLTTKRQSVALSGALLLAISPWHIQFSRTAYEVTLLMSLILLGLIGVVKALQDEKWLLVSAVVFALTFYTYSIAVLFTPLLILAVVALYFKELRGLKVASLLKAGVLFVVLFLPFVLQTLTGQTGERFSKISIFNNPQLVNSIEVQRNVPVFPPNSPFHGAIKETAEKIAHNRPFELANAFLTNYLQTFSTEFLFLTGDQNPRQSVGSMGEFYLFFVPLLLIGVYALVRSGTKFALLTYLLFVLVPVPAALTKEGGTQATRLFLFNLPIAITAGFGLGKLYDLSRRTTWAKFCLFMLLPLALFNIATYLHRYYQHNPVDGFKFWQYGYKDAITYIRHNLAAFDKIVITDRGDPALGRTLFHMRYNPKQFQNMFEDDKHKPNILRGFDGFSVGNMYFVEVNKDGQKAGLANILEPKTAYLISQEYEVGGDWDWRNDPPKGVRVLHTVLDPWQRPIFYVVSKAN